jgi:hypothetical protein
VLSLKGLDGSVAIDEGVVRVTCDSGTTPGKPIALAAASIKGAAVWTGVLGGQFSVHYRPAAAKSADASSDAFLSVTFRAADKEWWDAMASTIMAAVRRAEAAERKVAAGSAKHATATGSAKRAPAAPRSADSPAAAPHSAAAVATSGDADEGVQDAVPAAGPSFDGWLNRTVGLEASRETADGGH